MTSQVKPTETNEGRAQYLGRYRIIAQLGQGGMGAIHLAVTRGMGGFEKLVVLKELRSELARDSDFVSMFLHEVKLAGRLSHANIVQTIEAGQAAGRYYMAMEFLDGQTFASLLARATDENHIPLRLRLQIIADVLAGLHYAHELTDYDQQPLNVVHCDVGFANVFITYDGQVKLVDFGVARMANRASSKSFQGKLHYASPEQLRNGKVDRRSDVFSVGVMLWEALALRRMTDVSLSEREVIEARITGNEPKLASVANVASELAHICDRALNPDPSKRFATAKHFRAALMKYITRLGPPVEPTEIADVMKTEFKSERERTHQIINAHLTQSDDTSVDQLFENVPGDDDVTKVADLSTLIDSISSSTGASALEVQAIAAQHNRTWPKLVGAAVIMFTATIFYIFWPARDRQAAPETEVATATASRAATSTATRIYPSGVNQEKESPSVDALASGDQAKEPTGQAEEPTGQAEKSTSQNEAVAESERKIKRQVRVPVWRKSKPSSQIKQPSVAPTEPAPQPPTTAPAPEAPRPNSDVMGTSLEPLRKRAAKIDADNPFK